MPRLFRPGANDNTPSARGLGRCFLLARLVWNLADGVMGLMALTNLVAIGLLSGIAFRLLKDYTEQRRQGRDPVVTRDRLSDVTGIECGEDELTVTGPIDLTARTRQAQKHRDHLHRG